MLCATCLISLSESLDTSRLHRLIWLIPTLQLGSGLLLLWIIFYYVGSFLSQLPTAFHEGTFWEGGG